MRPDVLFKHFKETAVKPKGLRLIKKQLGGLEYL